MSERVLVLGAGGYVGRRLVSALMDRGAEVIGADVMAGPPAVDVAVDIRFPAQTMKLVHATAPTAIVSLPYMHTVHCAKDPQGAIELNMVGVNGVFEAATALGVPRVVYASSNVVHGDQSDFGDRAVTEDDAIKPRSLYGHMKRWNEIMADHYNEHSDTQLVGIRLSSLHGMGKGGVFNPLDIVVNAAAAGDPRVTLPWSASHEFSYLHVDDAISVFVEVALAAIRPQWTVYNSPGQRLTMGELGEIAGPICGLEVEFEEPGRQITHLSRIDYSRLASEFPIEPMPLADRVRRELEARRDADVALTSAAGR